MQWVGGTPACSKGVKNSCGIATVINKQGDWYQIVISNIDTLNFDVSGGDGWLLGSHIPDYAKKI
jgi:hypothetical protein